VTSWACQGRSELGAEHRLHKWVIASHVVGQRLSGDDLIWPPIIVFYALIFSLLRRIQVFVDLVEQPKQKLLSVVLCRASELSAVSFYNFLEVCTVLRRILARPQSFQHLSQLLGEFTLRTEFPWIYFITLSQISLKRNKAVLNNNVIDRQSSAGLNCWVPYIDQGQSIQRECLCDSSTAALSSWSTYSRDCGDLSRPALSQAAIR
jgi:hypothetical protein